SYIYFTLIRSTPTSTLFPYTTLFRSQEDHHVGLEGLGDLFRVGPVGMVFDPVPDLVRVDHVDLLDLLLEDRDDLLGDVAIERREDRKSTRLNSSHVKISYAVFCLKKK